MAAPTAEELSSSPAFQGLVSVGREVFAAHAVVIREMDAEDLRAHQAEVEALHTQLRARMRAQSEISEPELDNLIELVGTSLAATRAIPERVSTHGAELSLAFPELQALDIRARSVAIFDAIRRDEPTMGLLKRVAVETAADDADNACTAKCLTNLILALFDAQIAALNRMMSLRVPGISAGGVYLRVDHAGDYDFRDEPGECRIHQVRRRLRGAGPRGGVARCQRGRRPLARWAARTASATTSSSSLGTVRRSSRHRRCSVRPTTGGRPDRSGAASAAGTLSAALGRVTPGAAPPPTAASESTALASMPSSRRRDGERLRPRPQGLDGRLERGPDRGQRTGEGGLQGRQGELVDPQRPGGRASGAAVRRVGAWPSSSPHCGPPSSLSPLAVTRAAPCRSAVAASGSSGSSGCGASSPDPMSTTTGGPRPASAATSTSAVNPEMTKFDGWTLRMKAVFGPIASR